jgi:hypothetical protein
MLDCNFDFLLAPTDYPTAHRVAADTANTVIEAGDDTCTKEESYDDDKNHE